MADKVLAEVLDPKTKTKCVLLKVGEEYHLKFFGEGGTHLDGSDLETECYQTARDLAGVDNPDMVVRFLSEG